MNKNFSVAAIMTALTLVCLFGSAYIPTGKIALLAMTSMCTLVTTQHCGVRYAWIQYVAVSLLALLLIPAKGQVLLFIGLTGYYPIVKLHIERIDKLYIEWIVKLLFFTALLIVLFFVLKLFILNYLSLGALVNFALANIALSVLIGEVVFILYDYILSLFAFYYVRVIEPKLK